MATAREPALNLLSNKCILRLTIPPAKTKTTNSSTENTTGATKSLPNFAPNSFLMQNGELGRVYPVGSKS